MISDMGTSGMVIGASATVGTIVVERVSPFEIALWSAVPCIQEPPDISERCRDYALQSPDDDGAARSEL